MKTKIFAMAFLVAIIQSAWSQALVSISLTTANSIKTNYNGTTGSADGSGAYRFELLYSTNTSLPASATNIFGNPANFALWTDSGVYGSNGAALNKGKLMASASASAAGWTIPSNTYDNLRSVMIVGWSSNFGTTWASVSNQIATGTLYNYSDGLYGVSAIGTSYGGGGSASLPAVSVWNGGGSGATGISPAGLTLYNTDDLVLTEPPYIWIQPADQTVAVGTNLTLTVAASGSSLMYYWWKNSNTIAGATSASYQVPSVTTNDAGQYFVVVSNYLGMTTSRVATVTVVTPPVITQYPVGQTVTAGDPATLTVVASGATPLSYQWRNKAGPINGATSASLVFNPAQTNDWDDYSVTVSNAYGTVTSPPVTLVVYLPVSIATQPQNQAVPFGAGATFSVGANGFPAPSYQWLRNGTNILGAIYSSYTIPAVHLNNAASYSVLVSNAYSSVQSSAASLTVLPTILTPFAGASGVWGENVSMSVEATGSGTITYQWYKDNVLISGATNAAYGIPTLQLTDGGLYSVVISSEYGSVTNTAAQLVINPADVSLALYTGITIKGVVGYTYNI
jgi:hypothetical protein